MVPRVGIEPTLPKEPDFESGASTNSATPAYISWRDYIGVVQYINDFLTFSMDYCKRFISFEIAAKKIATQMSGVKIIMKRSYENELISYIS